MPADHYSFDDYLRVEEDSVIRHELLDGRIWAMAGGTPDHARICATERKLVVWRRTGAQWTSTEHRDGILSLALGCDLPVLAVYRDPFAL